MLKIELESSIDIINSILEPGSASNNALTEDQKGGLFKLKAYLKKDAEEKNTDIIPQVLQNEENQSNETALWLLSEFGGIEKPKSHWDTVRNLKAATRFVSTLKLETGRTQVLKEAGVSKKYAPDEWYKLDKKKQTQLFHHLNWENLSKWNFDIFEVSKLCGGRPLLFVGWAILGSPYSQFIMKKTLSLEEDDNLSLKGMNGYNFMESCKLDPEIFIDFLRVIESKYLRDVPYHNNTHGADVLQTTHAILEGMNAKDELKATNLQLFSLLVGAAIHDAGHPGFNNDFQIKTRSNLAIDYHDTSVLENHHLRLAFRLIVGEDGNSELNIFKSMDESDFTECRKMIIDAVLATDMSKHFGCLKEINKIHNEISAKEKTIEDEDVSWQVLKYLMHVADISNCAKQNSIAVRWTDRILDEFFRQGDKEKALGLSISPLCDREKTSRANSQIGFISYIIRPSFECAGKYLSQINEEIMPIIESNLEFWKTELEKEKESER